MYISFNGFLIFFVSEHVSKVRFFSHFFIVINGDQHLYRSDLYRISTKPLWGFSSSNPYPTQSRAEQHLIFIIKLIGTSTDQFRKAKCWRPDWSEIRICFQGNVRFPWSKKIISKVIICALCNVRKRYAGTSDKNLNFHSIDTTDMSVINSIYINNNCWET